MKPSLSWPEASLARLEPSFAMMGAMGFGATALRKCTTVEQMTHLHHAGNASGIVHGAAILGWGSAPFQRGALQFINAVGAQRFAARSHALAARYGVRFEPAAVVVAQAESGWRFED